MSNSRQHLTTLADCALSAILAAILGDVSLIRQTALGIESRAMSVCWADTDDHLSSYCLG